MKRSFVRNVAIAAVAVAVAGALAEAQMMRGGEQVVEEHAYLLHR